MLLTKKFTIDGNFKQSAQAAILEACETNGYPPNRVFVQEGMFADVGEYVEVAIGRLVLNVPVEKRTDLKKAFSVNDNEGVLDVCDPESVFESLSR